ncbi:MAG: transposase [Anaerolineae bacterium]|nr:transposase [Anaerolineae bacterium]
MTQSRPVRRSPRLQSYDYSQEGAYFVTICTHHREPLFGKIQSGELSLSAMGNAAFEDWQKIPSHYPSVELDGFVVMPNHIHGIIFLVGEGFIPPAVATPPKSIYLSQVIAGYKAGVTRQINRINSYTSSIWQRSFHDHIIRSEPELNHIRHYVANNPSLWEQDKFYG